MKRRILSWFVGMCVPALVVVGQAQPAAAVGTWYTLNPSFNSCGSFGAHPTWRPFMAAYARVGNDGVLSRGYIMSGANATWSMSSSCDRFTARTLESVYGSYTVSANGWGIDGFSVTAGWPSVNVSGWDKSVRHQLQWAGGHASGDWTIDGTHYFNAGSVGDVSSMKVSLELTFAAYNGSQLNRTVSQTSGNIQ